MKFLAQNLEIPGTTIVGPLDDTKFGGSINLLSIIAKMLPYIFYASIIGVLIMLLSGGFTYLTSAGDTKKTAQAQQQITNAIIGFILIFSAYWLVQIAGIIFGITEIQTTFK